MNRILGFLFVTLVSVSAWAGFEAYNGTTSLNIFDKIQCSTGLTCTRSSGRLVMVASPSALSSPLALSGAEAADSLLTLKADESDDNGDDWQIESDQAANSFILSNDTSGSQVAKWTMTTAGHVSMVGDLIGDGGDQLYGFLQNQVATTTASLAASQCGSTIISNSADVMALPEASTVLGCQYTIVCGTADDLDINPDDADIIGPVNSVAAGTGAAITPSAGDAIRCTDIGSSIVLEAIAADRWAAIGVANGAWTDVN